MLTKNLTILTNIHKINKQDLEKTVKISKKKTTWLTKIIKILVSICDKALSSN